jgi:hypothetical protein
MFPYQNPLPNFLVYHTCYIPHTSFLINREISGKEYKLCRPSLSGAWGGVVVKALRYCWGWGGVLVKALRY